MIQCDIIDQNSNMPHMPSEGCTYNRHHNMLSTSVLSAIFLTSSFEGYRALLAPLKTLLEAVNLALYSVVAIDHSHTHAPPTSVT